MAGRCLLDLPVPRGQLSAWLKKCEPVELFFGYRCGREQSWAGRITEIKAAKDAVRVAALSPELALIEIKVTECFFEESTRSVVRRLLNLAGLDPGRLAGPDEVIPHLIFSDQPVFQCLRQINETLRRVYEHDMRAQVYWQGQSGQINWGDFDEPGPTPVFASCDNLVNHNPKNEDEGEVVGLLFPGLVHSQLFTVRDARRAEGLTKRAQTVRHQFGRPGNLTTVTYAPEKGYA